MTTTKPTLPQEQTTTPAIEHHKVSIKLLIGVGVFIFIILLAVCFIVVQENIKSKALIPTPTPKSNNPHSGDLYQDIKIQLQNKFNK